MPDSSAHIVQEASTLISKNEIDSAIQYLESQGSAAPVTTTALLAHAYALKGNTKKGVSLMLSLCEQFPEDIMFQLELASFYWNDTAFFEGMEIVDKILKDHQDLPIAHYKKALFCTDLMQFKTALQHIIMADKQLPNTGKYIALKGHIQYKLGDYTNAIDSFKTALSLDEDEPEMMLMFAQCFKHLHNFKEYKAIMTPMLNAFPGFMDALYDYFMFHYVLGKFDTCSTLAQAAISAHPDDGRGYFMSATTLAAQQDLESAIATLDTAILKDPDNTIYQSHKASLLHQAGHTKEALSELKHSLKGNSPAPFSMVVWASILSDVKQYKKAIKVYKSALKSMLDSTDLMSAIGTVYRLDGDPNTGLEWQTKALKNGPKRAHFIVQQGLCYQDLNQLDKARDCFESALEMKPGLELAEKALVELGS